MKHLTYQHRENYINMWLGAEDVNDPRIIQAIAEKFADLKMARSNVELEVGVTPFLDAILLVVKAKNEEDYQYLEGLAENAEFLPFEDIEKKLSKQIGPHGALVLGFSIPDDFLLDPAGYADRIVNKQSERYQQGVREVLGNKGVTAEDAAHYIDNWSQGGLFKFIAFEMELLKEQHIPASVSVGLWMFKGHPYLMMDAENQAGYEYLLERNNKQKALNSPFVGQMIRDRGDFGSLVFGLPPEAQVVDERLIEVASPEVVEAEKREICVQIAGGVVVSLRQSLNIDVPLEQAIVLARRWESQDPDNDLLGYVANFYLGLQNCRGLEPSDFETRTRLEINENTGECMFTLSIVPHSPAAVEYLVRSNSYQEEQRSKFSGIMHEVDGLPRLTFNQFRTIISFKKENEGSLFT